MATREIQRRTFLFAVRIIKVARHVARAGSIERTLSSQLLRAGTSIGANLEEAYGAQSRRDFIHKLRLALKEARETQYWLRLIVAEGIVHERRLRALIDESDEVISVLTTIVRRLELNDTPARPRHS